MPAMKMEFHVEDKSLLTVRELCLKMASVDCYHWRQKDLNSRRDQLERRRHRWKYFRNDGLRVPGSWSGVLFFWAWRFFLGDGVLFLGSRFGFLN
jgi:hypothetical protein